MKHWSYDSDIAIHPFMHIEFETLKAIPCHDCVQSGGMQFMKTPPHDSSSCCDAECIYNTHADHIRSTAPETRPHAGLCTAARSHSQVAESPADQVQLREATNRDGLQ